MVERIGNDGILLAEQRLEYAPVCIEAGYVQDGIIQSKELGNSLL